MRGGRGGEGVGYGHVHSWLGRLTVCLSMWQNSRSVSREGRCSGCLRISPRPSLLPPGWLNAVHAGRYVNGRNTSLRAAGCQEIQRPPTPCDHPLLCKSCREAVSKTMHETASNVSVRGKSNSVAPRALAAGPTPRSVRILQGSTFLGPTGEAHLPSPLATVDPQSAPPSTVPFFDPLFHLAHLPLA